VIVLLHWLHAGVIIVGVLVVFALLHPGSTRRQDGRVAELRAAAEAGTLVRRAEARALAQLTGPVRARSSADHLVVPTSACIPLIVAAVSMLTGSAIHAAVGPEHFREGLRFGLFFVVLAVVQCVQAAQLVRRPTRSLLQAVLAVNGATIALWVATRTVGLPLGLAEKESVGLLDLGATLAELVAAAAALSVLVIVGRGRHAPAGRPVARAGAEAV
jgi:hypothetical protein